jgi:hypothetical protein
MDQVLRTLLPPARERRLTRDQTLFRGREFALGLVMARHGVLELAWTSAEGRRSGALAAVLGLSHEATYRALARVERTGLLQPEGGDHVPLPMAVAA